MKPTFVRRATLADVHSVAGRLREEDRQEVLAAGGVDARLVFPAQHAEGREMYAAGLQSNDRAEILFGADPMTGDASVGIVWLVSTPVMYDHPVEFVIMSRDLFKVYQANYKVLTNFVDARNTRHIRWLKWLGFHMIRRVEKFGAQSLPFIEFASYQECA